MNTYALGMPLAGNMQTVTCQSGISGGCGSSAGHSTLCQGIGPRKKREKVREDVRAYIAFMLGAPTLDLELDEQAVDFAIDQALMIIESYAPREYSTYYTFVTSPGQSVYKMPNDVGYIRRVDYKQTANFSFSSELDAAIPMEYLFTNGSLNGGMINPVQPMPLNAGEWTLYKMYEQMYSNISSNTGGWEWIGGYRYIKLYPIPNCSTKVSVHYLQKCKDWEEVTQAMQEGALSYAKEMLGRIRVAVRNLPGPNGGIQKDGDLLLQEAKEERKQWMEDLIWKFGEPQGPIIWG